MRYWVQYHNYEKLGSLPKDTCGIASDRDEILQVKGDTIFLIVGVSENPRQYLLWERFLCERLVLDRAQAMKYQAVGTGWFLVQRRGREPLLNRQPGFRDYLDFTANFGKQFHEVTDHPFLSVLLQLSEQCKPPTKAPAE